ncbi:MULTISPECIES: Ig-like domain-containing protein [unclassified Leptolyngbya]|uniref:calcium-binding protein n=1 Tax=unclassified Leptolyngbya TaxID=2650499 RepID=UPI00168616E4|nr:MULTISPECIES: Ig-like domain-containing protein [unclassified Leptolyngbya]MBD1912408.1 type I secretion C-terminal target domain-containing protein [Leptolyngbya sp. FACHB-8]MBD2154812.1 type I secretion C-terminal target domain-containing protein [Leptolyngbya sp. FACHB-16]
MVLEITVTDQSNSAQLPKELTDVNGKLYVTAQDANGDRELYFIGPNGAPTKININTAGSSSPESLTNVNGTLFFSALDTSGDRELFYLDANNNPVKVGGANGVNSTGSSSPDSLNNVNGSLYFRATNSSGALKLFIVDPDKNLIETPLTLPGDFYQEPVFIGDTPYYSAQDATGDQELYFLGVGYSANKIDVNPTGSSSAQSLTEVGSTLFFRAKDADGAWKLYFLGPNNAPTQVPLNSNLTPENLIEVDRTLYFTATNSTTGAQQLYYLTRNNAIPVSDNFVANPISLNGITGIKALTSINGNLYFSGTDATGDSDVFYINDSKVPVKLDINPAGNAAPDELSLFNGNLFFIANNGSGGGTFYGLVERISVTGVTLPDAKSYGTGQALNFVVNFDEVVNVDTTGGAPILGLSLDSGPVDATYVSGTGTKQLVFRYTITEGNADLDGISVQSLNLNGSVLQGNLNGIPTLTLPGNIDSSGIRVDTVNPTLAIAPVSSLVQDGRVNPATGTVTFSFSEAMAGFNLSDLQLTRNGASVNLSGATLSNNGGTYTLSGLAPITGVDGSYSLSLDVAGSGITDAAGNPLTAGGSISWKRGTTALPPAPLRFTGGLRGRTYSGKARNETILGTTRNDTLSGAGGNDTIRGYASNDILSGGTGNDSIYGGTANDRVNGGAGKDNLLGEGGNDLLKGDAQNDKINGGGGNDMLVGGLGVDTLIGGAGRDTYSYSQLTERGDIIRGFQIGQDVIDLSPMFRKAPFNTGATAFAKFDRFVKLTQVGASTAVQVDQDGSGAGTTFVTLATLTNIQASALTSRSFAIA